MARYVATTFRNSPGNHAQGRLAEQTVGNRQFKLRTIALTF